MYPSKARWAYGSFVKDQADAFRFLGHEVDVAGPGEAKGPVRIQIMICWRLLKFLLSKKQYGAIVCHFPARTLHWAFLALLLRRKPLKVFAHGSDLRLYPGDAWLSKWIKRVCVAILSWLHERDGIEVYVPSKSYAAYLRSVGIRSKVITPSYMPQLNDERRNKKVEEIRCRASRKVVLYSGRESWIKGFDLIHRMLANLDGADAHFLLVGDFPSLRQTTNLTIMAPLKRREFLSLLQRVDIVLIPSRYESFSLIAAEAVALKVPLVCSNIDAIVEHVGDGYPLMFESGDIFAFVNRLKYGLNNTIEENREFMAATPSPQLRDFSVWAECLNHRLGI